MLPRQGSRGLFQRQGTQKLNKEELKRQATISKVAAIDQALFDARNMSRSGLNVPAKIRFLIVAAKLIDQSDDPYVQSRKKGLVSIANTIEQRDINAIPREKLVILVQEALSIPSLQRPLITKLRSALEQQKGNKLLEERVQLLKEIEAVVKRNLTLVQLHGLEDKVDKLGELSTDRGRDLFRQTMKLLHDKYLTSFQQSSTANKLRNINRSVALIEPAPPVTRRAFLSLVMQAMSKRLDEYEQLKNYPFKEARQLLTKLQALPSRLKSPLTQEQRQTYGELLKRFQNRNKTLPRPPPSLRSLRSSSQSSLPPLVLKPEIDFRYRFGDTINTVKANTFEKAYNLARKIRDQSQNANALFIGRSLNQMKPMNKMVYVFARPQPGNSTQKMYFVKLNANGKPNVNEMRYHFTKNYPQLERNTLGYYWSPGSNDWTTFKMFSNAASNVPNKQAMINAILSQATNSGMTKSAARALLNNITNIQPSDYNQNPKYTSLKNNATNNSTRANAASNKQAKINAILSQATNGEMTKSAAKALLNEIPNIQTKDNQNPRYTSLRNNANGPMRANNAPISANVTTKVNRILNLNGLSGKTKNQVLSQMQANQIPSTAYESDPRFQVLSNRPLKLFTIAQLRQQIKEQAPRRETRSKAYGGSGGIAQQRAMLAGVLGGAPPPQVAASVTKTNVPTGGVATGGSAVAAKGDVANGKLIIGNSTFSGSLNAAAAEAAKAGKLSALTMNSAEYNGKALSGTQKNRVRVIIRNNPPERKKKVSVQGGALQEMLAARAAA